MSSVGEQKLFLELMKFTVVDNVVKETKDIVYLDTSHTLHGKNFLLGDVAYPIKNSRKESEITIQSVLDTYCSENPPLEDILYFRRDLNHFKKCSVKSVYDLDLNFERANITAKHYLTKDEEVPESHVKEARSLEDLFRLGLKKTKPEIEKVFKGQNKIAENILFMDEQTFSSLFLNVSEILEYYENILTGYENKLKTIKNHQFLFCRDIPEKMCSPHKRNIFLNSNQIEMINTVMYGLGKQEPFLIVQNCMVSGGKTMGAFSLMWIVHRLRKDYGLKIHLMYTTTVKRVYKDMMNSLLSIGINETPTSCEIRMNKEGRYFYSDCSTKKLLSVESADDRTVIFVPPVVLHRLLNNERAYNEQAKVNVLNKKIIPFLRDNCGMRDFTVNDNTIKMFNEGMKELSIHLHKTLTEGGMEVEFLLGEKVDIILVRELSKRKLRVETKFLLEKYIKALEISRDINRSGEDIYTKLRTSILFLDEPTNDADKPNSENEFINGSLLAMLSPYTILASASLTRYVDCGRRNFDINTEISFNSVYEFHRYLFGSRITNISDDTVNVSSTLRDNYGNILSPFHWCRSRDDLEFVVKHVRQNSYLKRYCSTEVLVRTVDILGNFTGNFFITNHNEATIKLIEIMENLHATPEEIYKACTFDNNYEWVETPMQLTENIDVEAFVPNDEPYMREPDYVDRKVTMDYMEKPLLIQIINYGKIKEETQRFFNNLSYERQITLVATVNPSKFITEYIDKVIEAKYNGLLKLLQNIDEVKEKARDKQAKTKLSASKVKKGKVSGEDKNTVRALVIDEESNDENIVDLSQFSYVRTNRNIKSIDHREKCYSSRDVYLLMGIGIYDDDTDENERMLTMMNSGKISVVFANHNIAFGVNLPFQRVILTDEYSLEHSIPTCLQMLARDGRFGKATQANSVIFSNFKERFRNYVFKTPTGRDVLDELSNLLHVVRLYSSNNPLKNTDSLQVSFTEHRAPKKIAKEEHNWDSESEVDENVTVVERDGRTLMTVE